MLDRGGATLLEVAGKLELLVGTEHAHGVSGGDHGVLRAEHLAHAPARAAVDLAAHRGDVHALAVVEVDAEEVILVAGDAAHARAKAERALRIAADVPVRDVDVVDVLFADMVA